MDAERQVVESILEDQSNLELVLLEMYHRQTPDEQYAHRTGIWNGVGFNKVDADLLTSFAEQIERKNYLPLGARLSVKQVALARKKLPKYHRQIVDIIMNKGGESNEI